MSTANRSLNESSFHPIYRESGIFWCMSFGLVGLLIFASNLATIVTFGINKHLRRQGIYCLLNLALADMLLGAVMVPYYIHDLGSLFLQWSLIGPQVYIATRGFYITVVITSLFSLVVVSLNRVYATYFPFKHRNLKTTMYMLTFVITWLLAIAASLAFFLLKQIQDQLVLVFQGFFVLALVIITLSYVIIFIKVKTQNNHHQRATTQDQRRERQLATTVFLVTAFSMITWIPSIIFHGIYKTQTSGFNIDLQLGIYLIHNTNSLINPVIYVFRMKDFRKALCKLFTTCLPVESDINIHSESPRRENNDNEGIGNTNKAVLSFDDITLDTKL